MPSSDIQGHFHTCTRTHTHTQACCTLKSAEAPLSRPPTQIRPAHESNGTCGVSECLTSLLQRPKDLFSFPNHLCSPDGHCHFTDGILMPAGDKMMALPHGCPSPDLQNLVGLKLIETLYKAFCIKFFNPVTPHLQIHLTGGKTIHTNANSSWAKVFTTVIVSGNQNKFPKLARA